MNLEHTFIPTNGIKLHVVQAGPADGEPVVLLHGFPEFWRGWLHQIEPLAAAGYRVIVPDQRGYNQSDVPKGVAAYSMVELGKDIIGLLDHLGLPQVYLVGHDWGAVVAWGVALTYPARVKKLAILNVPHPVVMLRFLRRDVRQMFKSWYIGYFQIPGLAEGLMGANNFAGAITMLKNSGLPTTFTAADLEAYRQAYANAGGLTGMINWYRALLWHRPPTPANPGIVQPTLILWGKKDVALNAAMAEASLKLCVRGKLIFFENATHWVQHDEAAAVTQHLLAFFRTGGA